MPDKILAILPEDFDLGFKLTGIDTLACLNFEQAKESLERELLSPRYSLILIDENFLLSFDSRFSKRLKETAFPLIMGIPLKMSFKAETQAKDYFLKMIQDAIGYEIRIK